MKKFLIFLLGFILIFQIFPFYPQAEAATCQITSPSVVTTNDRTINVTIKAQGLVEGKKYVARFSPGVGGYIGDQSNGGHTVFFTLTNGEINIPNLNYQGLINPIPGNSGLFEAKTYSIQITEDNTGQNNLCTVNFTVNLANSGGTCQISFLNTSFTPQDSIRIKVDGLAGKPDEERKVGLKRYNEYGIDVPPFPIQATNDQLPNGIDLGKHEIGYYYVEIRDSYKNPFSQRSCYTAFGIPQGPVKSPNPSFNPACLDNNCNTALGPISTIPAKFVTSFFGILLSLAGGIALILVIISGYRLMVSQGNPEKVQAAREQLTSAIVGLLFIIFSLSILQIIGFDILHIPGFF